MNQFLEFADTNMLLVAGTGMMFFAVIFYEMRLKHQGVSSVSTAQAIKLINQGATVVDIREQANFDTGHIVDSINVPATNLAADAKIKVKSNRPVVVVCDTGSLSTRCASVLREAGFDSVFSLRGGLTAWNQENLPSVSKDNQT